MSNSVNQYYAEGVIKELWIRSAKEFQFTLTPDKEYLIEFEHNGEKESCGVFRPEDFLERVCGGGVVDLYAGDFTFSVPKGMSFDQLLIIKVNGCHIRVYVENKDVFLKHDNGQIPVSEIRLKQK